MKKAAEKKVKKKPKINKKSKEIVKRDPAYQPIHKRSAKVLKESVLN